MARKTQKTHTIGSADLRFLLSALLAFTPVNSEAEALYRRLYTATGVLGKVTLADRLHDQIQDFA